MSVRASVRASERGMRLGLRVRAGCRVGRLSTVQVSVAVKVKEMIT